MIQSTSQQCLVISAMSGSCWTDYESYLISGELSFDLTLCSPMVPSHKLIRYLLERRHERMGERGREGVAVKVDLTLMDGSSSISADARSNLRSAIMSHRSVPHELVM